MLGVHKAALAIALCSFAGTGRTPPITHALQLGGSSGYSATTEVESEANLAKDAALIAENTNITTKNDIYTTGGNSQYTDANGTLVNRTLASLSLNAYDIMKDDMMYNLYVNAFDLIGFADENEIYGSFDENPTTQYGDTIVRDLIALEVPKIEKEAALVMNVWMMVQHYLYDSLRMCLDRGTQENDSGLHSLDLAAAYWIGVDQDDQGGSMLYDLAQRAAENFNQDDGEAVVNTNIIKLLNEIKLDVIALDRCTESVESGYLPMRDKIFRVSALMTVPLVQNLIHYMLVRNDHFMELYALALLPQVSACDPGEFNFLVQSLIISDLDPDKFDEVLSRLQRMYGCFGLSCKDVGEYYTGAANTCNDETVEPSILAGYEPRTDVRQYAKLDRDILQIDILTTKSAYDAAENIYIYGRNSRLVQNSSITSLHQIALTYIPETDSQTGSLKSLFANYYNDDKFGDDQIMSAFNKSSPYNGTSSAQTAQGIIRSLQTIVTPVFAIQELYSAAQNCSTNPGDAKISWDKGVAVLVGSIEGAAVGGDETNKGKLLFAFAKEICGNFGVCNDSPSGSSQIDSKIIELATEGMAAIEGTNCEAVSNTASAIKRLVLAALVQGTLLYATESRALIGNTTDVVVSDAHVLSRSILPLVYSANETSAETINRNMFMQVEIKPVPDGFTAVFDAFAAAWPAMNINCTDIGNLVTAGLGDFCSYLESYNNGTTDNDNMDTYTSFLAKSESFGRYTFSYDVIEQAKIALDLRDILNLDEDNSTELQTAKLIYQNGKNSMLANGSSVSLASFSLNASESMKSDPIYNFYRYAFRDDYIFTNYANSSDNVVDTFADGIVRQAFDAAKDISLASHAIVTVSLRMQIAHLLWASVQQCKEGLGTNEIDAAFAYYVGVEQIAGGFDGYLMYSLVQKAGARFGQRNNQTGEATVNTKIIELFANAKSIALNCTSDSTNAWANLRFVVDLIMSQMNVALIQNLIYFLTKAKPGNTYENFVELYALAVFPQVRTCNPGLYQYFREQIIDYDLDEAELENILNQMRRGYDCLGINCTDVGTMLSINTDGQEDDDYVFNRELSDDCTFAQDVFAGYSPIANIYQRAKVDRDILEIQALMENKAFETALEIYKYGHNCLNTTVSSDVTRWVSLQELAIKDFQPMDGVVNSVLLNFTTYYQNEPYADTIILAALTNQTQFAKASPSQLTAVVVRTLQTMVTYLHGVQKLFNAIKLCNENDRDNAVASWDTGVAFLIGTTEGTEVGGYLSAYQNGTAMYGLAKDMCTFFNTCTGSGNAEVNEILMEDYLSGQRFVQSNDCAKASDLILIGIVPTLSIPLVQGTIYFSALMESESFSKGNASFGSGFAIAGAILPIVNAVNTSSAEIIASSTNFSDTTTPDAKSVVEVFANTIDAMGIGCHDIGVSDNPNLLVCNATKPDSSDSTSLSDGLYTTTTYVEDRSKIDLDVIQLQTFLKNGNVESAVRMYKEGENSVIYDKNGAQLGVRSFGSFSTLAGKEMNGEPVFTLYKYALGDANEKFLGEDVSLYANSLVMSFFDGDGTSAFAIEAAVALNLWMYVVHELQQAVTNCKNKQLLDNDGVHSIDEAVAYWIGSSQQTGDAEGHLLYALAESSGALFKQDANGQVRANTNILRLFNEAKLELSFPNACLSSASTHKNLRVIANNIVSQMTVPLIQQLIANLKENDRNRVRIYAVAVVPLIAGCNPSAFTYLKEKLITSPYNVVEIDDIILSIQSSYSCLGLSCLDIGDYSKDKSLDCTDKPLLNPLAGYVPSTDVRDIAEIDLDILQIDILMTMGAVDAAHDLYTMGKHASVEILDRQEILSLQRLATTNDRSIVPSFKLFKVFFGNNDNYADTIVEKAFYKDKILDEQRRVLVIKAAQYLITYMSALQSMYSAIADCKSGDMARSGKAANEWDRAAALLIGSLEGISDSGSIDGCMIHRLAQERCQEFNVCASANKTKVNEELITFLYAGRSEVATGNCNALDKTVRNLEGVLKVPLIQSSLHFAIVNSKLESDSYSVNVSEGYISSRSILPYVKDVDPAAADVISKNLDYSFSTKPVPDGDIAVMKAFADAIPKMQGVNCKLVGDVNGQSICQGGTSYANNSESRYSFSLMLAFMTSFITYWVVIMV